MDLRKYYDQLYRDSADYHGGHGDLRSGLMRFWKIERLLERYLPAAEFSRWRVLDVGCSTGDLLLHLKSKFLSVAGVDISETAVMQAQERGISNTQITDIEHETLPFPDNTFHLVFCLEIFEHLFTIEQVVSEIKRVLVPGGYLFVSVPNDVLNWRRRAQILFGRIPFEIEPPIGGSHIRHFSATSLARSLATLGLETVAAGGFPLSYRQTDLGWIGRLAVTISPDLFAANYFVIARLRRNDGVGGPKSISP
ncbi:MAG: methyltransferase domain-containing protein [Candidatus Liptonbacteria bacterium]|nr:methyltransferase domain-containing protein [Candidatus Liptonbacteria bacterium]